MEVRSRFLKTWTRGTAFADVVLEWLPDSKADGVTIIEDLWKIDEGNAEVDRRQYSDWIDAAIAGLREAVSRLVGSDRGLIILRRVRGTNVDTTTEVVAVAACVACWKAVTGRDLEVSKRPPWLIDWS